YAISTAPSAGGPLKPHVPHMRWVSPSTARYPRNSGRFSYGNDFRNSRLPRPTSCDTSCSPTPNSAANSSGSFASCRTTFMVAGMNSKIRIPPARSAGFQPAMPAILPASVRPAEGRQKCRFSAKLRPFLTKLSPFLPLLCRGNDLFQVSDELWNKMNRVLFLLILEGKIPPVPRRAEDLQDARPVRLFLLLVHVY